MLSKFGYRTIFEAHDGAEAVRQMSVPGRTTIRLTSCSWICGCL
jgi:hypothetical protein